MFYKISNLLHFNIEKITGFRVFADNYTEGMDLVKSTKNYIFIGDEPLLSYLSSRTPSCDMAVLNNEPFNTAFYAIAMNKHTPENFVEFINKKLLKLTRYGRLNRLKHKWWKRTRFCKYSK